MFTLVCYGFVFEGERMSKRGRYHHGSLREALMEAALRLVKEKGLRGFSLREASREAGVAASAPYRHFSDRGALMTAIAEESVLMLMERTNKAMELVTEENALRQYQAMGVAYVKFAAEEPTRFLVMSDTEFADSSRSELLKQYEEQGEETIRRALSKAKEEESASALMNQEMIQLAATAMTYGLAKMFADGHFARAGVESEEAEGIAKMVTDILGAGIANLSKGA